MKVLVVDDDRLVTSSLKTILESDKWIEVVATGNNGEQAVELYKKHRPDILLIDIRMDGMTGLDAAEKIIKEDRQAKVLFLTTFSDDEYIIKAFQIGAKGYILKQNFESIIPSVKAVYMGQRVFGDEIINKIPAIVKKESKLEDLGLTEKEIEIIMHVAEGLSNKKFPKCCI